jgi:ankyrin repeat protein
LNNVNRDWRIRDIFDAAGVGNVEAVRDFLAAGVDVNILDASNVPPIHMAAYMGHIPVMEVLHEAGARVNIANHVGYTPLMAASRQGIPESVEKLIEYGADVNARFETGETPLMFASAYSERTAPLVLLISGGAHINAQCDLGLTALMRAIMVGSLNKIKLLLAHGANPAILDNKGRSALDIAIERGFSEIADYLANFTRRGSSADK